MMNKKVWTIGLVAIAGGVWWYWRRKTLAVSPRVSVPAVSAVTGGPAEDINLMRTAFDPQKEGPIYDGSDLSRDLH